MRASAHDVIHALLDDGSWQPWEPPASEAVPTGPYAEQLAAAAQRAGTEESIVIGQGLIEGATVALIVGEFQFLAGSVGHAAADRIIEVYERASAERLPVIAAPVSGGTRMQEGTPAFLRMAGIAAAAAAHRSAGLPSLALLRGPTTGGVLATWGSLAQVTAAEPGALIGFLGPRVFEEVTGQRFPEGVQTAEHLYEVGIIDAVVDIHDWRDLAARLLRVTNPADESPITAETSEALAAPPHPDPAAWQHVLATRAPERPGAREWLAAHAQDIVPLRGTGAGEVAQGLVMALARFHGRGVVVIAQDRQAQAQGDLVGPGSLRSAQRAMRLAAQLQLPLVTVVDTPGAELSPAAEEGAMAGEIARTLALLSELAVPTVAVLLGQGTGGGAIALLPCDRVVAAEHAWVTPLPPEGAAAIVHRDAGRAPEMASAQRITAGALAARDAVDVVIPERGDWLAAIGAAAASALEQLTGEAPSLVSQRRQRWRRVAP